MTLVLPGDADRRRVERRTDGRVMDLTLPEVRRILVTTMLFAIVVVLFLWMVRTVLIAAILGMICATYLRPAFKRIRAVVHHEGAAAMVALVVLIVPIVLAVIYSYVEVTNVLEYLAEHQAEVSARIDESVRRIPFLGSVDTADSIRSWVLNVSNYGASIPGELREAMAQFAISATIFLFTAWYIFVDIHQIEGYLRAKVPPRYSELYSALERNVRGVLDGAIYATLVTQLLKSVIVLILNLIFGVPLAFVLAIVSFVVGFFPIVGSWSVYLPVAAWLLVFRGNPTGAVVMVFVGFVVNTLFISTYLRPKIAADKSRVLNFYWMFVALVTGVYTFGLAGILLGPVLIGMLKAAIDTVTARDNWRLLDLEPAELETGVRG